MVIVKSSCGSVVTDVKLSTSAIIIIVILVLQQNYYHYQAVVTAARHKEDILEQMQELGIDETVLDNWTKQLQDIARGRQITS